MSLTALITGATSGIGLGFAHRLASEKYNLIIVSRSLDKLENLQKELQQKYSVRVDYRVCDLSHLNEIEKLCGEIEKLQIDLLINNAGIGQALEFAQSSRFKNAEMMNLNMFSVTQLCQAVLSQMKIKKSGQIINVASMAGFQAGPYMAIYYATKAYVISFSEALHEEVKPYGIAITALCPGPVETGFQKAASYSESKSFLHQSIENVVEAGLRAVRSDKAIVVPGILNSILVQINRIVTRAFMRRLMKKRLLRRL